MDKTAESLRRDRERRQREREKIASLYEEAADILMRTDEFKFYSVVEHLKREALRYG